MAEYTWWQVGQYIFDVFPRASFAFAAHDGDQPNKLSVLKRRRWRRAQKLHPELASQAREAA